MNLTLTLYKQTRHGSECLLCLPGSFKCCLQESAAYLLTVNVHRQVVGVNGSGNIPYRTALTAVFFEGIIFMVLGLTGMRQWLVKMIPASLKTATGVGIGFFLTEIGLSYSAGIGAITGGGTSTPLALGGCPPELIDARTGACSSGQMTNPKVRYHASHPSLTIFVLRFI